MEPQIIIEGMFEDWPGGPQTLKSLHCDRECDHDTFWFGARLDPGRKRSVFRITHEALQRMPENTPQAHGALLVERLIAWIGEGPDHQLEPRNEFQVIVSNDGDMRIEPWNPPPHP